MDRVDYELNDIYCRKSFLNILMRSRAIALPSLSISRSPHQYCADRDMNWIYMMNLILVYNSRQCFSPVNKHVLGRGYDQYARSAFIRGNPDGTSGMLQLTRPTFGSRANLRV